MKTLKLLLIAALAFCLCGFSPKENSHIKTRVIAKFELPTWYHEGLYFDGKNIWVVNGLKGKTWVVDSQTGKIVREIETAGAFTEAITSIEKESYLVTDWDLKKMYAAKIKDNVMSADKEVTFDPAHPAGAVWTGKNLFVITWLRSLTGTKFKLLKMDDNLNILLSNNIRKIQEPCQAAWDGKNLWISSWYNNNIYKIDTDTLELAGHFRSPVKKTTGIAWDGKYFWITGTYADLYKVELQN